MKTRFDRTGTTPVSINILPLLDVVFCILSFFVLVSAGLAPATDLGIALPEAKEGGSSANPPQQEMLIVTLDKAGNRLVDGERVDAPILQAKIKLHLAKHAQGIVVLNAQDTAVTYKQVIDLLQELKNIAGDRVAIATTSS